MGYFSQIFILFAYIESIGLNDNIIEAGVFNIIALYIILFIGYQNILEPILIDRYKSICQNIENATNKLDNARLNLIELSKQLSQNHVAINEIKNETIKTKSILLKSNLIEVNKDIKTYFERAVLTVQLKENQLFLEIKQQIISFVLKKALIRTKQIYGSGSKEEGIKLINESINKLEGDLG